MGSHDQARREKDKNEIAGAEQVLQRGPEAETRGGGGRRRGHSRLLPEEWEYKKEGR